jgi:hypothetical protein
MNTPMTSAVNPNLLATPLSHSINPNLLDDKPDFIYQKDENKLRSSRNVNVI